MQSQGTATITCTVVVAEPGNATCAQDLVLEHLDLVQQTVNQVAARFPRQVERDELWNAGALGLVEAANRYDPDSGVPFAHFARARVRGAIIDSTRDRDWAARSVRRKTRRIRTAEVGFVETHGRMPEEPELAALLDMTVEQLRESRDQAAKASLLYLDHTYEDETSLAGSVAECDDSLIPHEALEQRELIGTVRAAVAGLPEIQREVIERYYLGGELLQDIARTLGVTEARVSQMCAEAVASLRALFATRYEGVPEVADRSPGKRARAAYLSMAATHSSWLACLQAADGDWSPASA
jgi:RNA polymerase sigma factor for flagellar operon FliA